MTLIGRTVSVSPPRASAYGVAASSERSVIQNLTQGDWVDKSKSAAHLWNLAKTGIDGRAALSGELTSLFRALKGVRGNAIFSSLKGLASAAVPLMTRSALFEAAISALSNGVRLAEGRIGFGTFAGRLTGDTMTGFVGGAGAAVAGSMALAILPATGLLATIIAGVAGIGGYGLVAGMFKQSSIYRSVVGTVRDAFGGR